MSCSSCCSSSCPEPVGVSITNTVIQIDGSPAMNRVDGFEYGDSTDNRTFALSFFPYEPKSVQVFRNSGAQRYGVDYTVQGQYVVLSVALASGEAITAHYMSVDGSVSAQVNSVGMLVDAPSGTLDGFLRMDGTAVYSWSAYPTLATWFMVSTPLVAEGITRRQSLLIDPDDDTNFTLKLMYGTSYDGSQLVTLNKFISLGAEA